MNNNSKIFRLFISSTFRDFQLEREILQTKVFPEIKEYCSSKGYTFQPIDLRWGVSDEAQIDQKALEMCIKEVQSCKKHDYPNFLIMLGDRYGWVPLPNIIEASEFELILKNVKVEDKELLLNWYYEDKNQLPTSFILKQRISKYDKWLEETEPNLRRIFQNAIENLDDTLRAKFITSATESEAIEGIISYFKKTEHQNKLLQLMPELEQLDHQHIFGFFRDIDKNSIIENKFISDDYDKAQEFKDKVKRHLVSENILHVNTYQVSKDKLDEQYLDMFILSVTKFLKHKVDIQIKKNNENNHSNLEIEKQQQYNYLVKKLENFLGREKVLEEIQNYINNEDGKPLIICGQSGIGKSCIIAKAVEDTSNTTSKKIIYRFVGASPNSITTKDILTSIMEELNVSLENTVLKERHSFSDNQNNFFKVSDTFYNMIMDINSEVVIFIDAVDQLSNDDQFLWLPNELPSNIKIIISTLKDREYKEDSKYFYMLEDKISKYTEIEPFNKPIELLELLLTQQNRTLQEVQKEYFLNQYCQVKTPLYVYMAANEIQYWKSSETIDHDITLSLSQKEIVKIFIENLTTRHHHNQLLVQKIFGYILASKDGLSEYEILELINTDKELIKKIAPNDNYTNTSQELPLVIWTRLHNHIKPFLKSQNQDGQELLYFFHREFIDVIKNQPKQGEEHEAIIEATRKIIKTHQDKDFESNRWGKLYILLVLEHYLANENEDKAFQYYDDILLFLKSDVVLKYLKYIKLKLDESIQEDNSFISKHLIKILIYISNKYKELSDEFYIQYIGNLHYQATILIQEQDYLNAIEIEEKNIEVIKSLPIFEKIKNFANLKNIDFTKDNLDMEVKWLNVYLQIKQYLGFVYLKSKNKTKALEINKDNYLIYKSIYKNNPNDQFLEVLCQNQIGYYAMALQQNGIFYQAIDLIQDSLNVLEKKYNEEHIYLYNNYAKLLHILSGVTYSVKEFNDSINYFLKAREVYEKLLRYDFTQYSKTLISLNNYLIDTYNANNLFVKSEQYYMHNIKLLNKQGKKGVEDKIATISDDLFMKVLDLKKKEKQIELFFVNKRIIEYVFNFDKEYWAKFYVQKLIALGGLLNKSKIDDNQLTIAEKIQKEGVDICEQYMAEEDGWYDLYTKNMNNLANTYTYLNKKDESYLLNKKNLDISTKLFKKDQQRWFRAYYYALENMATTYFYIGDSDKEREYKDQIKELESNPSFQLVEDVKSSKAVKTKITYFDFFYKAILLIGVYFFIKYVFLE